MPTDVVMPQMGESIAEGTITKWLVKAGDRVERDQPLFEISTDKVDAEIPSPAAGVLTEILHQEGATVPVGQVVARLGEAGEQPGAAAAPTAPAAAPPQPAAVAEAPAAADAAPAAAASAANAAEVSPPAQAGGAAPAVQPAPAAAARPQAVPAAAPAVAPAAPAREAAPAGSLEERVRKYSSPLVRKMAQVEGVDIEQLEGTGIHGRVTKRDLEAHLADRRSRPVAVPAPSAAPARPAAGAPAAASGPAAGGFHVPAYTEGEPVDIEPMAKIRQITAAHMAYSKRTSAHVTTVFHLDMTRVNAIRNRVKDKFLAAHGTKLTYMPFIFAAVAASLRKHRKLNASIDGNNVVYKKRINLGMAVALDRGLLVPVLADADQKSLPGLAKTANDLADRARAKKLLPDELKGGTFTITNPGVFGSLFGTPIINQPQVAILGIGTIEKRPVVVTDEDGADHLAIRVMSYFGITYDHRLVDGADADHFMNDVKKVLETGEWPELQPFQ
jgi:pyruvate dehydrogenase E2 component (dihydrolipoamide acetyltransferase)